MNCNQERQNKRKNLLRWRLARLRRLHFEENHGNVTPRQRQRIRQLQNLILTKEHLCNGTQ